jgi:hypothetical protein
VRKEVSMSDKEEPRDREELEEAEGELLPDREVMSVITTGLDDPAFLPVEPPLKGGEEL